MNENNKNNKNIYFIFRIHWIHLFAVCSVELMYSLVKETGRRLSVYDFYPHNFGHVI